MDKLKQIKQYLQTKPVITIGEVVEINKLLDEVITENEKKDSKKKND